MSAQVAHLYTRLVPLPLPSPITTPHYRIETIWNVILSIQDDSGQFGTAYLWAFTEREARTLVAMLRVVADDVVSMDPARPLEILDRIRGRINFLGYKGVTVFALSAIDMAIIDLRCRQLDISLPHYFGYEPVPVPVYWSGLFLDSSVPELLAEVDMAMDSGFGGVKLRVGASLLEEDLSRVAAVTDHLPTEIPLMLDAVQRWEYRDALTAAKALSEYRPLWLEDPVRHNDYEALRDLSSKSSLPIASGENEYLTEGFSQLFDTGISYALADLQRVGGIHEWWKVADAAARYNVTMTSHTYPHVSAQLCARDGSLTWLEYVPWWDELMDYPLKIADGLLFPSEVPGNGLVWNWDAIERYAIEDWETL